VATTAIATLAMFCLDVYDVCERREELKRFEEQRHREASLATIGLSGVAELAGAVPALQEEQPPPVAGPSHMFTAKMSEMNVSANDRKAFRSKLLHKSLSNNSSFDSGDFPLPGPMTIGSMANKARQVNGHSLDSLLENTALKRKFSETTSGVGLSSGTTGPSYTTDTSGTTRTTTTSATTGSSGLNGSSGKLAPKSNRTANVDESGRRLSNSNSMPDLDALLVGGRLLLDMQQNERLRTSMHQATKSNEPANRLTSASNVMPTAIRTNNNLSAISEEIGLERMIEDLQRLCEQNDDSQNDEEMNKVILEQQLLAQDEYLRLIEQLMRVPIELQHEQHCPALKLAELLVDRIVSDQPNNGKERRHRSIALVK
jgi:hypothetical protein